MKNESLEQARLELLDRLENSSDVEFLRAGCRQLVDLDRQLFKNVASQPGDAVAQDCAVVNLGNSLGFLADLCVEADQLDEAERHYREASLTYERRFGSEHWGVASTAASIRLIETLRELSPERRHRLKSADGLYDEARSLEESGQLEAAVSRLEKAFVIEREIFGEDHLNCGQTLNWHAGLLKQLGKLDEAAELYVRGNAILLKQLGETHPSLIDGVRSLAFILQERERYVESAGQFESVLAATEKNYGQRSNGYFIALLQLASAYERMQSFDESLPLCQQALRVAAELHGQSSVAYITAQRQMAGVLAAVGQWDEAEREFLDALNKLKSEEGGAEVNSGYVNCVMETANFYGRTGKWPLAHMVLRELREYLQDLQRPPGVRVEEYDGSDPAIRQWMVENEDLILEAMRKSHELDMLLVHFEDDASLPPAELMRIERQMLWRMDAFAGILEIRGSSSAPKMRELRDTLEREFRERRRRNLADLSPESLPPGEMGRQIIRLVRVCLQNWPWPWGEFDQARFQAMSAGELACHLAEVEEFINRFETGTTRSESWFRSLFNPQPAFTKSLQARLQLAKKMDAGPLKDEVFPRLKLQIVLYGGFWQCVKLAQLGHHKELLAMVDGLRRKHGIFAVERELDEAEESTYYSIATLRNLIVLFEYDALAADPTLLPADRVKAAARYLDEKPRLIHATKLQFAPQPEGAILGHLGRISTADFAKAGVTVDRDDRMRESRVLIEGRSGKHLLHVSSSGAVSLLGKSVSD